MKVLITRRALTSGVFEAEADLAEDTRNGPSGKVIKVYGGGDNRVIDHYHKPDWHTTRKDALLQVMKMILSKQASLRKQMDKLNALSEANATAIAEESIKE